MNLFDVNIDIKSYTNKFLIHSKKFNNHTNISTQEKHSMLLHTLRGSKEVPNAHFFKKPRQFNNHYTLSILDVPSCTLHHQDDEDEDIYTTFMNTRLERLLQLMIKKKLFFNSRSLFSQSKIRNVCLLTYRQHSVYRKFKLSRNSLKKQLTEGNIVGFKKF